MGKVKAKGSGGFLHASNNLRYVSAVSRLKQAEKAVYIQIIV